MQSVTVPTHPAQAGPGSAPAFPAPDPAYVGRLRSQIRLADRTSLVSFGDAAQNGVASFADTVLKQTLNKDAGPVGELLAGILSKARSVDPTGLNKVGVVDRLLGGAKAKVSRYKGRFTTAAAQIDRVSLTLERLGDGLRRDIAMMDGLFDRNLAQMSDLEAHILAAEQEIELARASTLPELRAEVARIGDGTQGQVAAQRVSDIEQGVERLERKAHDLRLSRMLALQAMPQIRLVQNADAALVEKLQTQRNTTIPAWKNGMVIALAIHRRDEALALSKSLDDDTNAMLRRNAEQLRVGTVEVERAMQRGVVDVETLAFVNQQFIQTVEEIVAVQREGRAARIAARAELDRIETELKSTVLGRS